MTRANLSGSQTTTDRKLVRRERLLAKINNGPNLVWLLANFGQGKTVLSEQLAGKGTVFKYRFESTDNLLPVITSRLGASITRVLNEHALPAAPGDNAESTLTLYADELADLVNKSTQLPLVILDQLEQLDEGGPSQTFILNWLSRLSPQKRVVLISQRPSTAIQHWFNTRRGQIFDHTDLAFDKDELELLAPQFGQEGLTSEDKTAAISESQGWPEPIADWLRAGAPRKQFDRFFNQSIERLHVNSVPAELKSLLLRLCLSRTFSASTLESLSTKSQRILLNTHASLFGCLLKSGRSGEYRFHPAYQRYLKSKLTTVFDRADLEHLYETHLEQLQGSGNLRFYFSLMLESGRIGQLNSYIQTHKETIGMLSYDSMILGHIESFGESDALAYPYIQLLRAKLLTNLNPIKAAAILGRLTDQFKTAKDEPGELIVLLTRGYLQMTCAKGLQLQSDATRLRQLAASLQEEISGFTEILLRYTQINNHVFIQGDTTAARSAIDQAIVQNTVEEWPEFSTRLAICNIADHLFHQRTHAALSLIEKHESKPPRDLPVAAKVLLHGAKGNWLSLVGDQTALKLHVEMSRHLFDESFLQQTQTGGLYYLWRADFCLLEGKYNIAEEVLREAENTLAFTVDGDIRIQGKCFLALALAANGQQRQAKQEIDAIDSTCTALTFAIRQQLIMTATFLTLGDIAAANNALNQAIATIEDDEYLQFWCVCAAFRYLLSKRENKPNLEHLKQWANGVSATENWRLLTTGYTADILRELIQDTANLIGPALLSRPFIEKVTRDYMDCAITDQHEFIERLRFITYPSRLIYHGEQLVTLTRKQEQLLFLLALSEGQSLTIAKVKGLIWPNVTDSDSRFYTMISRLKSRLKEQNINLDDYLSQSAGRVKLKASDCDAVTFEHLVKRSEKENRAGHHWYGNLLLATALEAWRGQFDDSLLQEAQFDELLPRFTQSVSRLVQSWSLQLNKSQDLYIDRFLEPLAEAEPENLNYAGALYRFYDVLGRRSDQHRVKRRLASGLIEQGIAQTEVNAALDNLLPDD